MGKGDVVDAIVGQVFCSVRLARAQMQFTRRELLVAGCALTAACGSGASQPSPSGSRRTIAREYFGIHCPITNDRQLTGSTAFWSAFEAGSTRIWNLGLNWRQIEPARGSFDWTIFDRFMNKAAAAGMNVLYVLGQAPDWAAGSHQGRFGSTYNPLPPRSTDDWANYVAAVARRYRGKIHAYELWNEANLRDFYDGDPAYLVKLATVEIGRAHV